MGGQGLGRIMDTNTAYLAIGSNIETPSSSRYDFLSFAVRQLSQHEAIQVTKASSVYETRPVGFSDQENFFNAVIEISTTLQPRQLLDVCLNVVEKRAGRVRTIQDGPRTLDVDILLFGDENVNEESLTIPHPRMNQRAFVIIPLSEIAPDVAGDLANYEFVDSVEGVVQLEENFDHILKSYKDIDI